MIYLIKEDGRKTRKRERERGGGNMQIPNKEDH